MSLLTILLSLLLMGAISLFLFLQKHSSRHKAYFAKLGIPYIGSGFFRFLRMLRGKSSLVEIEAILYQHLKDMNTSMAGYSDLFVFPAIYCTDLDLIKNIFVKDFDNFVNRRKFTTHKGDLLFRKMLLAMDNDQWRWTRSKLSPIFTTGKIKRLFAIFDKSSQRMCAYLKKLGGPGGSDLDICEVYSKFSMDVIASCAFGVDSKTFDCGPGTRSEFEEMGQRLQFRFKPFAYVKFVLTMMAPWITDLLGAEVTDTVPQEYFLNVITTVMNHRRKTGERQEDFLQLMMEAQKGLLKNEEEQTSNSESLYGSTGGGSGDANNNAFGDKVTFDDADIVANCVLFLIGGFDSVKSTLIFGAHALATEPEVQERLFQEVRKAKEANGGRLTYDAIQGMEYLDMFVNETLRCYPPFIRLERVCTKDYTIPGTNTVIQKGVLITVPIIEMHRDSKYYPNPSKFDPERFSPAKKQEVKPYSYAPFGHGQRNCIGMRFALSKMKVVLAHLVHDFKLEPCSRTEIPVQFGNSQTLTPKGRVWLNIRPRAEI